LSILVIIFLPRISAGQEKKEYIPDGTQGEML
jgi:hypothetical protein